MAEAPIGERVTAVEVSLRDHVVSCERKRDREFRLHLVVLATVLAVLAKVFGALP